MTSLPYQYIVLRAVPRVDREEFLNVGVVLFCQAADVLTCDWHVDPARLTAVDPELDLDALRAMLATVGDVCAGRGAAARPELTRLGARFGWLAAPRSTILQPGPVHGGTTEDPYAEVARLCATLVTHEDRLRQSKTMQTLPDCPSSAT